jgi:hypothetical protein
MIVITGLTENLSGNRSGRAGLKEGADVAVREWSPQKKPNHRKEGDIDHRRCKHSPQKKGRVTPLGCSAWTALRREQCGVFTPCKNCWVTKTSKHACINRITSVYSSLLGDGQRANELTQWESRDLSSAWYSSRNNRIHVRCFLCGRC